MRDSARVNTKMATTTKRVHESDDDDDNCAKFTVKTAPKKKWRQSFLTKYSEKFPVLRESVARGPYFAFCTLCKEDFSVEHGGLDDCRRHVKTTKHDRKFQAMKSTPTINELFGKQRKSEAAGTSFDSSVTKAEAVLVSMCAEMNLPFTAAQRFTQAAQVMFPDSAIAKKMTCGRSKAAAYVKKLAQSQKDKLHQKMKTGPFTISTDGSNDVQDKQFPLVVRTVESENGEVRSELLSVPVISDASASGENIFSLIKEEFVSHKIPRTNCLAMGSDNAPVMTGPNKGVYGFMKKEHGDIYLSGCVCHLIHIAAQKAAACLPVNLEEMVIDIFYYLDKSSKKQTALKMWQLHHEIKASKMLKHCPTRWLSLGQCLPRILESWKALNDFFKEQAASSSSTSSTAKKHDRLDRLKTLFKSPTAHLYCHFLNFTIKLFDETNALLQCDEPKIHSLRRVLCRLQRNLFDRYLKPVATRGQQVKDVDFKSAFHHKKDDDLIIGDDARAFIAKGNNLQPHRLEEVYACVKKFFIAANTYIRDKLPLECELLKKAEVADPTMQTAKNPSDLSYFLNRFKAVIPPGATKEDILLEYSRFQSEELSQSDLKGERVDLVWHGLKKITDETGSPLFKHLPDVMLAILTIPHSSAHCERIFSCVRKTKTAQRASMGQESLDALLVLKAAPQDALTRQYSSEELAKLKSCYWESVKTGKETKGKGEEPE